MCEQSYWNPLEDPPCQSPLDDPLRKGANTKTYTLTRKARVYSGEKYGDCCLICGLGDGRETWGPQAALTVKNPPAQAGDRRPGFSPWVRKVPWSRAWQPTPVFLPGESHGQRSLTGYSPWGHKASDTPEETYTHTHTHTHTRVYRSSRVDFFLS